MKIKNLLIPCGMLVLAYSCNNADTKKTDADSVKAVAPADTVTAVAPAPAEVVPVIDSAAITREFLAARKTNKKPAKSKKQGNKEVEMYSEPTIPSHEALEQPAATKANPTPVRTVHTKEYVYYIPAQKPSFPGGDQALAAFIAAHVVYPEEALNYRVEGTVFAEVYLDSLGTVKKVETPGTRIGAGLEEETVAVLMESPRWHPAKENGKMVKSKVTVPVTYKIKH